MPLRFMIGFIMMWALINAGCNWLTGLAMTSGIPESIGTSGSVSTTFSQDPVGAPAQYQGLDSGATAIIQQWAFFDYPALFNDENGNPDETRSMIRYSLLVVCGLGFLLSVAWTVKQIFF